MALIQGTAYRARRRMQWMTSSGTMPSTGRPAASSSRTCELETGTCGPSTHSALQPGGTAGTGPLGRDTTARVTSRCRSSWRCQVSELGHQIGPHHQEQLDGLAAGLRQDLLRRLHRVAGAAPLQLEPAGLGARDVPGKGLGQRKPVLRRRDGTLPRLLPGIVGDDEEEAVEGEPLHDRTRCGGMPGVRRVEGAAEDPDPVGGLRCRQVRRSPAPARPSLPRARRCS